MEEEEEEEGAMMMLSVLCSPPSLPIFPFLPFLSLSPLALTMDVFLIFSLAPTLPLLRPALPFAA